ncbi:MAG: AmmeMemoRadiSam system radical SAM enzyme [Pseudomonadota bacterium]
MDKEALFYKPLEKNKVQCNLCNHNCVIPENKFGLCNVRQNFTGKLYSLVYGKLCAASIDPIEKKPLYHYYPGSKSFSIATVGCNLKCLFCQNHNISQISDGLIYGEYHKPDEIVKMAKQAGCETIAYTYTEPTVFIEYAYDVAKLASKEGIKNIFVTNGFMSKEAIAYILPFLDACNIDLKFFNDETYKKYTGANLEAVCDNIKFLKDKGIWLEITTLLVTGLNDSEAEIKNIAEFIASVDKKTPWHISRFYPNYKIQDRHPTNIEKFRKAIEIGKNSDLEYIYIGNVPGDTNANTYCPDCDKELINRFGYRISEINITDGKCEYCGKGIPGVFY